MKKLASKVQHQGSVPFYGCTKCRYSRGGCINWQCHPDKFKVHFEKNPHMYEPDKKTLKVEALKKLKNKDLVGGGSQKVVMGLMFCDFV